MKLHERPNDDCASCDRTDEVTIEAPSGEERWCYFCVEEILEGAPPDYLEALEALIVQRTTDGAAYAASFDGDPTHIYR